MADAPYKNTFDVDKAVENWERDVLQPRKERAAQYMLAELASRTPAKSGAMRGSESIEMTPTGFLLKVSKYYAYFVDKGHKVGSRQSQIARAQRSMASELRRVRKATGDESLKERELAFRRSAKKINEKESANRREVPGTHFVENTLNAIRDNVIDILAGK